MLAKISPILLAAVFWPAAATHAEEATEPETATESSAMDTVHDSAENWFHETVGRIDNFFMQSDYATFQDNKSRVRLRLNTDYIEHHGWELSPKLKLNLQLPGFNERLRLVMNDDQGQDVDQASSALDEDNDIALRFMARQNKNIGISGDLGLRIKSGNLDPFARINTGFQYPLLGKWVGQTTNRLYYYSETGWRNDLRQFINRPMGKNLLLRSRTRLQYFEENDYNPFVEQKFSLYHTLKDNTALAYEVMWRRQSQEDSPFDDDEVVIPLQERYDHVIMAVRYRRQLFPALVLR